MRRHFNGKIESPRIFSRSLSPSEIGALRQGDPATDPVATWDFSLDIASRKVTDTGPNHLHGRTVQMPMRAATGHLWSGNELNFKHAPTEYGAIYFHDDDLDDASWEADFELRVPADLKSGVYATRLRAGTTEYYIPFFVRPTKGTATSKIAFLIPTFSYLAYANFLESSQIANSDIEHATLLSLYDKHSDGSGVAYSSRLRPNLMMRPKLVDVWNEIEYPHQLTADLHLVDWLEQKAFDHDVITDEDLHWEGKALLEPYNVILTGTHPEYWSGQMLEGLRAYLQDGGRLMYLGGNGFYWVTSMDLEQRHTVEIRRHDGGQTWEAAPGEYYHSTTGEFGGLWRARGRPPNSLVGVGFTSMGAGPGRPFHRQPDSFDPRAAWIFEGIGPDESIGDNPSLVFEYGAAGMEVDRFDRVLGTPPHALLLATAKGFSNVYQGATEEVMMNDPAYVSQEAGRRWVRADMVYFETPNDGAVFSASSINWCGNLFYNNYDNAVSKITENVLKRFVSDKSFPVPTPRKNNE
jgi:N,N-dimethylformamidase